MTLHKKVKEQLRWVLSFAAAFHANGISHILIEGSINMYIVRYSKTIFKLLKFTIFRDTPLYTHFMKLQVKKQ